MTENGPAARPLVSISIPVLNEEANLPRLYDRLSKLADAMSERCQLEFVFTDNASTDGTWPLIRELAESDSRIQAIRFSKNVGFQKSILVNYMHTKGEAVMQIDADLQDPPEMLGEFLDFWETGYQIVYGVRRKRQESWLLNLARKIGYRLINSVSSHDIPKDAGDFRLLDRKVVDALVKFRFVKPYIRGTVASLGFKSTGIAYDRQSRVAVKSKFSAGKLIKLGLDAIYDHSNVPLRVSAYTGLLAIVAAILGAIYYVYLRLNNTDIPEGMASIHILVLMGIGLNAFLLGVVGEYIQRIYLLIRSEPIAVVEDLVNLQPEEIVI